jgi:hypothetical protein
MADKESQVLAMDVFEELHSVSQRFIPEIEFSRFVNNCATRTDTIFIIEYECVLVEVGGEEMSALWVEAFRRLHGLGVKVHVLAHQSPTEITAADGRNIFHKVHQCRSDRDKIKVVEGISSSNPGVNLVCCGTEFVYGVRCFTRDDFVYHIHSLGLPPWQPRAEGWVLRMRQSSPISIHREFVIFLMSMVHLFCCMRTG